ncbi:hypothetical protein SPLC1_S390020 [Arthrospira platensis C1]|nr:hypothetical protein SPLC1_S390020 [Arthrospira platensis C1]
MIPVNGKPIGSYLTLDRYHIGHFPNSAYSGYGGRVCFKANTIAVGSRRAYIPQVDRE